VYANHDKQQLCSNISPKLLEIAERHHEIAADLKKQYGLYDAAASIQH
jgi:hypothetical protein